MLTQGFQAAWNVYLQAGPWLPPPPPPLNPRRVSSLSQVLDEEDIKVVVLDAYGVLHTGGAAIAGAAGAVADVRRRGLPLVVLTNDVSHEPSGVADGLRRRGLDIHADEVVSGRDGLPAALAAAGAPTGKGWGVVAIHPGDLVARFADLLPLADMTAPPGACWRSLAGLVLVDCFHWNASDLDAFRGLMAAHPLPLIIPNPDVACPYDGTITIEPGALALAAARMHGVPVHFLGKPFAPLYEHVKARFPDIPANRMLMVGDSPHTDVLGARGAGLRCLLVESGLLAGQDALARCAEAALWPDFLAPAIGSTTVTAKPALHIAPFTE